ncbi:hypothetical protein ACH5RR_020699 [Cinchona calisaya]|uniref:phosphopyruvate hydratase n=1 Tax=Cinchona calisaya TaxID=153742 RepID=A0ABD2ZIJ4_9GENT
MDPILLSQVEQAMIDLDKTEKKGELRANAILAVSMAACKAGAAACEYLVSGGQYAGINLPVKQIMILPIGAKRFEEALHMVSATYHHLKAIYPIVVILWEMGIEVVTANHLCAKSDIHRVNCKLHSTMGRPLLLRNMALMDVVLVKKGFAPSITNIREGLDLVKEAISRTGYNEKLKIAMDVAATEFCIGDPFPFPFLFFFPLTFHGFIWLLLLRNMARMDVMLVKMVVLLQASQGKVVGDDFLVSNPKRIEIAVQESACNALVLKVNQIGTVTEAIEVVKMAKDAHWGV